MVMECEFNDKLAVSETGSIGMGINIEDEVDVTTEFTKFDPDDFSCGATPDGASVFYVLEEEDDATTCGAESEAESVAITMETLVRKPGEDESSWRIAVQIFFPFIVAGLGMVGAGVLLGIVQHWDVFVQTSELFILVPALLGLKGNLEMTLASRLSTQANLGNMDSRKEKFQMVIGNLALIQAQANLVGFLASALALALSWIPKRTFDLNTALLLAASSVTTAALASLILGLVMIAVVLASRKLHINPDNVATPIAASLGDVTCLSLLSGVALALHMALNSGLYWVSPVVLVAVLGLTPIWWVIAHRNPYARPVLYSGWIPIIGAMTISSLGGLILDHAVGKFTGLAAFQPVMNGVGGNLVAIHASRLSTSLHCASSLGSVPEFAKRICPNPLDTFFGKDVHSRTVRVLMALVVPGHIMFMYAVHYMRPSQPATSISLPFAALYITAAILQVAILLYLADWLVHLLWRRGHDPDNYSIPFLTAIGDLLGVALLASVFYLLHVLNTSHTVAGL